MFKVFQSRVATDSEMRTLEVAESNDRMGVGMRPISKRFRLSIPSITVTGCKTSDD